jgi:2-iminoacetate synthase
MIINNEKIENALNAKLNVEKSHVLEIINKAKEMKGLSYEDILTLLKVEDKNLNEFIFEAAREIKDTIYGNRLVLFAPLYISNLCSNDCLYCAFRATNKDVKRKALNQDEIKEETINLLKQGHKRVLLVAGEAYPKESLDYILKSIDTVYATKHGEDSIRRINVNIAPLSVSDFKRLHDKNIGTYQIFQETYHLPTYKKMHVKGPKADYDYRLTAIDRAFEAGFDDVGIGVLFGLYDWRYEILALKSHIEHLEKKFGVGPHTISVPRLEPAVGSDVSVDPPYPVTDDDFKKIIAVLRLAVPYTGIILSTRENSKIRKEAFNLGISQISAGSKTDPGGYSDEKNHHETEQFSLGDTRSLHEVIEDVVDSKYIPSFCTGCYRLGRVGKDFMDLAKPGLIKAHCLPNAMFTFSEYLYDFANDNLKEKGIKLINNMIEKDLPNESIKENVKKELVKIKEGKRDIYF